MCLFADIDWGRRETEEAKQEGSPAIGNDDGKRHGKTFAICVQQCSNMLPAVLTDTAGGA